MRRLQALVRDGQTILSSVVASQVDFHKKYGGVVPEIASRRHIEAIGPVLGEALERAGFIEQNIECRTPNFE